MRREEEAGRKEGRRRDEGGRYEHQNNASEIRGTVQKSQSENTHSEHQKLSRPKDRHA